MVLIRRKAYTRADGTRVKATTVKLRKSKRTSKRVSKRTSKRVSKRTSKRVSKKPMTFAKFQKKYAFLNLSSKNLSKLYCNEVKGKKPKRCRGISSV